MDKLKLVEKLREKTGITYEDSKRVLEINNWDILDAILYLEKQGKVKSPSISIFYTNEYKESYEEENTKSNFEEVKKDSNYKSNNTFEGIFEVICKAIDTCNNIFIEIKGKNNFFLKFPLTVVIILLIFGFWLLIPLVVIALFLDIEFSVESKNINTDKINDILSKISKEVQKIKGKGKVGGK
ncbi:MAG: ubiquitin [Clostridium celatum]|uniref:ubiquitin n=1 Tax=uncultured Clostridium sp. TaxID=59620 RepID=UPI0025FF8E83|nr:ubiquitin [uncultured Clostridium sp.]MDU4883785.1 ubiquitin [Clostridium celatum]MDU5261725.1 ubiquitin [Clostridium celatum]MDU7077028.1 ubiquitin [Clostridium celatum]